MFSCSWVCLAKAVWVDAEKSDMKKLLQFLVGQHTKPFAKRQNAAMQGLSPWLGVLIGLIGSTTTLADWGDTCYWKSGSANGNWDNTYWYNTTRSWDNHNPGYVGGQSLNFDNTSNLSMTNNWSGAGTNMWRILFQSGTGARTIAGTTQNTFRNNGTPKIENYDDEIQTVNFPFRLETAMEINPVNGDLTVGGNIDNNGQTINVYGANSKMLTLSGVVSGAGKLVIQQYSKVKVSGASTYTGNTEINAGELWVATGGKIPNISTNFVGNGAALSTVAKMYLESSGVIVTNPIRINPGDANTRYLGSLNTSGTASYRGAVTVNGPVNLEAASGGTVEFNGTIGGTAAVNKTGSGVVILTGTNTYTSTNQIQAGTLRVPRDSALGATPGSAAEYVNIWSTGTLEADGTFTMNANRRIVLGTVNGPKLSVTSGNTLTYGGQISGSANWSKESAGQVTLSSANTYSGALSINGGVVRIQNADALGTTAGGTTVASGSALEIQGTITTAAEGLTLNGTGISSGGALRNTANANTYSGAITLGSASRINSDSSTLTLGSTVNGAGYGITFGGAGTAVTISGVISGSGTTLTKDGACTLNLNNTANTYTGSTTVNGGSLAIAGNDACLGAAPGVATVGHLTLDGGTFVLNTGSITLNSNRGITLGSGGGTFDWATRTLTYGGIIAGAGTLTKASSGTLTLGGVNTYAGATTINGGTISIGADSGLGAAPGVATPGHLTFNGGALTCTASFALASNRGIAMTGAGTINVNSSYTVTYGGVIAGSGALTKAAAGVLTLSGANTYGGATTISAGTLRLGANDVLSDSTAVTATGTLDLNGYSDTIGSLAGAGAVTLGSGTLTAGADNTSTAYSGTMTGTGGLTKNGSGTLTVSSSLAYSGNTTVSAGTLALSGSGAIGSSPNIILASGGNLDVSGLTTALSLGSGQTLKGSATGANTTATITMGATKGLTLSAGGLAFTAYGGGATAPITVAGAGELAMNGAPVTITTTTELGVGTYTLIAKSGSATVTGTPGTLTINGSGYLAGTTAELSTSTGALVLTITTVTTPTITGAATATAFTTTYGTASAAQNFAVSGTDLVADLVATAPTGFEVSSDGVTYGTTATFAQSGGSASGTLRIRLKATAAVGGSYNSQNIVLSSSGATSVNIGTASSGNTVSPLAVTLTGSKTYDGSTDASYSILTVGNKVGSDDVTVASGSGTLASAAAGSRAISSLGTLALGGTAAGNYTITGASGSVTINALAVSLSGSKTYDGNTTASYSILTVANKVGTDDVTLASGSGTLASANVGSRAVSSVGTLALGGTAAGNYTLTGASGSVTIGALAVSLSGSKAYDGNTTASYSILTVANKVGTDDVTLASGSATLAGSTAGSQSISSVGTLALGGTAAGNYTLTGASGSVTITAVVPTLTTPTATSIGQDGATLGATVTSAGGTTLTSRGTVWGTAANPTGNGAVEGGTTVDAFSHARTGLSQGTKYYYRGYAVNSAGTAYSADGSFYTEPGQASGVTFANVTPTAMRISWTAGADSDGSIVIVRSGNSTVDDPVDGTVHTANAAFATPAAARGSSYVVYRGSGTQVDVTGLTAGTTYYVEVFAYKGTVADSGADQGINYRQTSPATGNQTSTACAAITVDPNASYTGSSGSTVNLTVTATGSPTYAWRKRGAGWGTSGAWSVTAGGGGTFVGASSLGTSSWGMYNNSGAATEAVRDFGALAVGDVFYAEMDNGGVTSGKSVGMTLRNSSGQDMMELYFSGGATYYTHNRNEGAVATTVPYTTDGLEITVTIASSTTYSMSVKIKGGSTYGPFTGTFINSGSISRVRFFNYQAGSGSSYDLFFNNIKTGPSVTAPLYDDSATGYSSWSGNLGQGPLANGGHISGATTDTLTISSLDSGDVGNYDVVVYNACGSDVSTVAAVAIRPTDATWDGGSGADNNTLTEANWVGDLYPLAGVSSIMRFAGSTRTTPSVTHTANSDFGSIYFNSGASAFTVSGNALTLNSLIQNDSSNLQTINNALALGAGTTANAASGDLALGGVISGANSLTKSGTGTLTLSGANTFSGGLVVNAGVVSATTSASAMGADGVTLGDTSGSANVTLQGDGRIFANPITVRSGSSGTVKIRGNTGNTLLTGGITMNKALSLVSGGTYLGINSSISGSSLLTIARDAGTGYVNLNGDNSAFTGGVNVESGVLRLSHASSMSSANDIAVPSGSILDINIAVTIGGLSGAGMVTRTNATSRTLTISPASGSYTFSGVIENGNASGSTAIGKAGAGTLTLSGVNTYSGNTTVSAGTLIVSGSSANSTHTVASGATLMGAGTVGALTINGKVDPGNAAAARATLASGAVALRDGGSMQVDISNVAGTAGTDWDLISSSGAITPTPVGEMFTIVVNDEGATGFDNNQNYSWKIIGGASVGSFNAARFTVDATAFAALGGGAFSVANSGSDGVGLYLVFTPVLPSIALADNGTQIGAGTVNAGTSSHVLHKLKLTVADKAATLTALQVTTAGTYASADLTNLKLWYSADATFGSDTAIGTITTPGTAGAKDFTSLSQALSVGEHYLFVTADIAAGATGGNTISVGAVATSALTFSAGTKSGGPTTAGGTQTILSVPVLTLPTATSIGQDGATLGATVTSAGGTTLTSRGTVWGTSANPTGNGAAEGGTAVSAFSHARTGLSQGTKYYYRGYAVNSVGTAYSPDGSFYTEPGQASVVTFANVASTAMRISWTAGADSDGSIVVVRQGNATVDDPVDGTLYTGVAAYGTTALGSSYVVYRGSGTQVDVTGLTAGTTYYVEVFGYKGTVATSGVDQGINYRQTTPAAGNQTTLTCASISVQPAATYTGCVGSTVNLTVTATGSSPSYAWRKRGGGWGSGGAWSVTTGSGGVLIGASSLGTSSWGMWNDTDTTEVRRDFGSMSVGHVFYVEMDNSAVATGKSVGFSLRNSSDQQLLVFYFNGGDTNYKLDRNEGVLDTGVPYTTDGLEITLTLTSSTTFSMSVKIKGGSTYGSLTGTFKNSGPVSRFQAWNFDAGGGNNLYFNNLKVGPSVTYPLYDDTAAAYSSWSGNLGQGALVDSGDISGASTATLSIANLESADAGTYDVVVYNSCGGEVSSSANGVLSVVPAPVGGTATATAATICTGSGTTITLAGSTGTIQWEQSANGSTGWANVTGGSGATTTTYTTPNLTANTWYRAALSNGGCGPEYSSSAAVTVNPASVGGTATATAPAVASGGSTTITLTGYTGTIQWYSSTDGISYTIMTGETADTVSTGSLTVDMWYRATVTSGVCGSANSSVATVTVRPMDSTWDGGGSTDNTMTDANWVGDLYPQTGASSVMRFAGASRLAPTVNYPVDSAFGSIYFNSGASAFTLSGNAMTIHSLIRNDSSNLQTINNALALGAGVTVNAASGNLTLGGVISGANSLTKAGSGTLTLSGANTFSTGLIVQEGTVSAITSASALGADGVTLGHSSGSANALIQGAGLTLANAITVAAGSSGTATIRNNTGTTILTGGLTLNKPVRLVTGDTALTIQTTAISGAGGITIARDGGTGQVRFSVANPAFTGGVTIESGVLRILTASSLSAANTVVMATGSTLDLQQSPTIASLSGDGTVSIGTTTARTLTISPASGSTTFSGVIEDGSAALSVTKGGAGISVLSGVNTYSGATTVSAGTLIVSGSAANSAHTVGASGTLMGAGSVGALTVNGAVDPGNTAAAAGSLAASSLTLGAGGRYTFDISNVTGTPGTEWDLLNVGTGSGTITVSSTGVSPFVVYVKGNPTGFSSSTSYSWILADAGTISGMAAGEITVNTTLFTPALNNGIFTVIEDGSHNLVLIFTPAPASVAATDGTHLDKVTVTWADLAFETGYKVYRNTADNHTGETQIGGTLAANTTSFDDTTADPGTLYYYWVKGVVFFTDTGYSASDSGYRKLAAPANLAASDATSPDHIAVTWDAVTGATGYRVYRDTDAVITGATDMGLRTSPYNDTNAVAGDLYYYWVRAESTSSSSSSDWSGPDQGQRQVQPPTLGASAITFSSVSGTGMTVGWTRGNGDYVLVVAKQGSAPDDPTDLTVYDADAAFGSGDTTTAGSYVVYKGTGTSVPVTSLSAETEYHFAVYEFNSSTIPAYRSSDEPRASQYTLYAEPTVQATTVAFSTVGTSSMDVSWANGNGSARLVIARAGNAPSTGPVDATVYTANADFSAGGSSLGLGKVVYSGSGNSFTLTGLNPETQYYLQVYEYRGSGLSANYFTDPASGNPANHYTLSTEPSAHASPFTATAASSSSISLSWGAASGAFGYMILQRAGANPTGTPTDGQAYSVSDVIGDATVAAIVTPGTSVTISGLSASTAYHFSVIPYNWNASVAQTYNYRTAATIPTANATTFAAEPTTQASSITVGSYAEVSMSSINWTDGNGASRLVVAKAGGAVDSFPVDGTAYTANAAFGSGTQIGTGNYVVHAGSGPIATLSNLGRDTVYHFRVFEFNGSGVTANYLTSAATGNPGSQTTLAGNPPTQATTLSVTPIGSTTATLRWAIGAGCTNALVAVKASTSGVGTPTDKTTYTAGTAFGSGSDLGSSTFVVYKGTGTSVEISGLTPGATYWFVVYMYNGSSIGAENYETTGAKTSFSTLVAEPTQATSLLFSDVTKTGMTVSWTPGTGANRMVVVRALNAVNWAPTDATAYSTGISSDFTTADDQGSGNKIVYSGSGSSVILTGMTVGTLYHVKVYEFAGTGATLNYNVDDATGNPASQSTLNDEPPTLQASGLNVTAFSETSLTLGWTVGNGDRTLLVAREDDTPESPVNGETYSDDADWTGSPDPVPSTGTGDSKAIYADTGSSVLLTGLTPATRYEFTAFAYNVAGYKYLLTDAPTLDRWTLSAEPANHVTGLTASGPTSSSLELSWTGSAGSPAPDGYLLVRKQGSAPTFVPADGQSYAAGPQGDSIVVVLSGGTTSRSVSGLSPSTMYYFALYPFCRVEGEGETYNYKTDGTVPAANAQTSDALLIKDQFNYTAGDNLNGKNGNDSYSAGWSGAWSVTLENQGSATATLNSGSLTAPSNYPTTAGNKVRAGQFSTDLNTERFMATRSFTDAFTEAQGRIYAAALVQYDWNNNGVFVGMSLMSNTTEVAFIGRPLQGAELLGADSYGAGQSMSTRSFYGGNTYLLIVRYNFSTRKLSGLIYNSAVASGIPAEEPGTWDIEVDVPEGRINQVTGLRLAAGNKPGNVDFDEIRVGNTWSGLLGLSSSAGSLAPTIQASQFQFGYERTNQFNVAFSRGNGAAVLVLARQGGAVNANPVDGATYTANATFGSGTQVGTGNYVVYNGSDPLPSFVLQNLLKETTYHFKAFEYNLDDGTKYLTSDGASGNPSSYTTLSPPTAVSVGMASTTGADLSWTQWNNRYVMVVYNVNATVTFAPTDGSDYSAGAQTGGIILDTGANSRTSLSQTGLSDGSTVNYKFFSRNNNYYSDPVSASLSLVAPTLDLYDGFERSSGDLPADGAGGIGWGATYWYLSNWDYADYSATSLPGVSAAAASGNKAVFYGDVNGRYIDATRPLSSSINNGTYYLSWRQNYANGTYTTENYAGVRLLNSAGTVKAFIGKYYDSQNLRIANYSGPAITTSGQAVYGGTGNDYIFVVKLELDSGGDNDVIRANVYKSGERLLGEEPIVWDVSVTNAIDNIGQIRLSCGANAGGQIGFVYYDEIRMTRNWTEGTRYDGQNYKTMLETGPTPELIYIGTDYSTANSPVKTEVTDADLADSGNKLDIAVRWSSPYGVFLTNSTPSLNDTNTNPSAILSTSGNVVPNWDPLMRSGGNDTSLGYDRTFAGFVGANGSTVVTSYYSSAFTGSEFGSWNIDDEFMITVSGQTYPSSGSKVNAPTAGAEQVPDRRAFSINMELPFTVVDDDPEPPIVQGFSLANYTDAQMTNESGFAISGQIMDDYSGVEPTSITFSLTNANPSPVFDNVAFSTRPGSSAATKGVFAALSHTVPQVPYADNQTGTWAMVVHGTDVDNDRANDSATTNRIFNFTVVDDDPLPPTTVMMNFPGALMNVPFIVVTNGTAPGEKIRGLYVRREGTVATNILTRVTDADLAHSGTTNLQFVLGAQDVYSGPARGTTGDTNTVMSFNIGNIVQGQFANYNAASSTAFSTNALTNYWTFADGDFSAATIHSMLLAGQMQVLARIPDLDNDRPNDRGMLQTQVGFMQVLDEDIRGPVIRRMDVEGAYGEADTVFSSFEVAEGWTTTFGNNSQNTIVDSLGRTWYTRGVTRDTLSPKFTSTYRMGLLVDTFSDPWIQLPPILNPGTFSVYGGRFNTPAQNVDLRLEYNNAGTWQMIGSALSVTNTSTSDPAYELYQWNVDLLGVVTMRLTRAATGPQIYFDDIEVIPAPLWTNSTSFNVNWSEVVDDYSQVDEYRVVTPSRAAVPPTAPTDGVSISAALTNAAINVAASKDEQGILNGYLVAVDNDSDRGTVDRAMGTARALKVRVDRTPPLLIPKVKAVNDMVDDPSSQFDLSWNEDNVEMGSDDPSSPVHPTWNAAATTNRNLLSPWRTYKIYYGAYDPFTEGGNIYGDFVSNGEYKNWDSVSSTNTIEDPGAGAFQPNYTALTNPTRKSIRLYDLDYDKDYIVVVVGVDKAGNESAVDNLSWSTNNTIKFAVTQGLMRARTAIESAFPTNNNLQAGDKGAAALYWLAAGQTNAQGIYTNVTKEYDLIYWDAGTFQESSNITWQPVGTAKSNWFADARGQDHPPRGNMRFYRASYKDRWQRSRMVNGTNVAQRPLASEDVYAMHSVVLSEGYNYVALHGQPYTNTFAGVFGTDTSFWPGSMTPALATRVQFFTAGVNAPVAETYFFGNNGGWYKEGGSGANVADTPQEDYFFSRGFAIILPPLGAYQTMTATDVANTNSTVPAMMWNPVVKVPTNGPVNGTSFSHVISCGEMNYPSKTEVYNVVALNLPVAVHPSQMGLTNNPNMFRKGSRGFGDEIYTLNTSTKGVLSSSTIYCDTAGVWRFVNGNGGVPWGYFKPNDVIVIVSRNGGVGNTWTWTYSPTNFYRLPTRWMGQ